MDQMEAILKELSAIRALLQQLPELQGAVLLQMIEEYRAAQLEGKKVSDLWVIAPPSSR
ncbi:hypothetical protein ACEVJL_09420 [Pseudoflavonifractor sp. P01025]|uniref:hypothetical protein n=1 Tax=Flintibacter porci TaxID=3342383 RepID=UPI0035B613CA